MVKGCGHWALGVWGVGGGCVRATRWRLACLHVAVGLHGRTLNYRPLADQLGYGLGVETTAAAHTILGGRGVPDGRRKLAAGIAHVPRDGHPWGFN